MNFKEALEVTVCGHCPPEEIRGACKKHEACEECREVAFAKLLELLERDYEPKERDSLDKIEHDARKAQAIYWNCGDANCAECPVRIDGETLKEHYKAFNCTEAQIIDLLRRQRELLEERCKN